MIYYDINWYHGSGLESSIIVELRDLDQDKWHQNGDLPKCANFKDVDEWLEHRLAMWTLF